MHVNNSMYRVAIMHEYTNISLLQLLPYYNICPILAQEDLVRTLIKINKCYVYVDPTVILFRFAESPSFVTTEVENGVERDAVFRCRHKHIDALINWEIMVHPQDYTQMLRMALSETAMVHVWTH